MKLELKNIKRHAGLSQETHAYTATVYWENRKLCEVENAGHGGGDMQHPIAPFTYDDIRYVNALCENELPMWGSRFDPDEGDTHRTDLEMWCSDKVNQHLLAKDLKRAMNSKVLVVDPAEEGVSEYRWKGVRKIDARHIDAVRKDNPALTILNDLPFAEALVIYASAAA